MTLIVKTVTRITVGLILIYGIYIVLQGHISPGGGFAGGVIIALSFIHLMLAFGRDVVLKRLNQARGLFLTCLAALTFLFIVRLGFSRQTLPAAGEGNFEILNAGFIPLADIAVSIMVGAALFTIFLALVLFTGTKEEK